MTAEIMLVDILWLCTPGASLVSEVADKLLLFRVHAQDGTASILKSFPEVGDQLELTVAIWVLRLGDGFAVDSKGVLLVLEQLAHGIGAHVHSVSDHFPTDRSRVSPAPLLIRHRIASRLRFHYIIQECNHFVFFLTEGR